MTTSSQPDPRSGGARADAATSLPEGGARRPTRPGPKGRLLRNLGAAKRTSDPVVGMLAASSTPAARPWTLPLWLLLVGRESVHRRWPLVTGAGVLWIILGLALVADALDGATHIPDRWFGLLLALEAVAAFIRGLIATRAARRLRLLKAALLFGVAVLTMLASASSTFLLAMLFGTAFLVDGASRIVLSQVLRFPGWRWSVFHGSLGVALGLLTLEPWPTWYAGTVGFSIGAFLILGGVKVALLGLRLRRLPTDVGRSTPEGGADTVTVYVWTPTGTASIPARQRLVHRYVVSVNGGGHISTGHASLEMCGPGETGGAEDAGPDTPLYVSHYPAVEIDRSPDNLRATLRAGPENNVPGRFLPSYRAEADDWCEATVTVTLHGVDGARLRAFWARYRQDTAYNLVGRNCSTAVANALDAAIEGSFNRHGRPWWMLVRAVMSPEFWAAAVLRNGAGAMTWTPGLVLDYARALSTLVDPVTPLPAIPWQGVRRRLVRNWRAEAVARKRGWLDQRRTAPPL